MRISDWSSDVCSSGLEGDGGYKLLRACLADERTPEELIEILSNASLRGLGGAGFPTGKKWQIVRGFAGPRLMSINADEGEPGTFKDRHYLERDPRSEARRLWEECVHTCRTQVMPIP